MNLDQPATLIPRLSCQQGQGTRLNALPRADPAPKFQHSPPTRVFGATVGQTRLGAGQAWLVHFRICTREQRLEELGKASLTSDRPIRILLNSSLLTNTSQKLDGSSSGTVSMQQWSSVPAGEAFVPASKTPVSRSAGVDLGTTPAFLLLSNHRVYHDSSSVHFSCPSAPRFCILSRTAFYHHFLWLQMTHTVLRPVMLQ